MDTTRLGSYPDGRTYRLGDTWIVVDERVRDVAAERVLAAFETPGMVDRVAAYYDPARDFAGSLVSSLEPNPADEIVAADLVAVASLSMRLQPLQIRALLDPAGAQHRDVRHHLSAISLGVPITSLDSDEPEVSAAIDHMWDLYELLRSLMAEHTEATNRWVFASSCVRASDPISSRSVTRWSAATSPRQAA